MNVFIVGLGLIGASYAEKLSQANFTVYGYDHDEQVMQKAKENHIIDPSSTLDSMDDAELVIAALYPKAALTFFKTHALRFTPTQTLSDVSGIKTELLEAIDACLPSSIGYLSHHPMAGKEHPGIDARDPNLFKGMNFLIVEGKRSRDVDYKHIRLLADALEVGTVSTMNAHDHDTRIAFTSQLTHVLAASLMHSEPALDTKTATGDSFRDLTRIANINAVLWSELFIDNAQALNIAIERFETALKTLKDAINDNKKETLEKLLNEAKVRRQAYD